MPVRSLSTPVLKWPNEERVREAAIDWARRTIGIHPEVEKIGYFGSYASGDWGVGSDIDIVIIVAKSDLPYLRRGVLFETKELPVPADLLVYTSDEWDALIASESRFAGMLAREIRWLG